MEKKERTRILIIDDEPLIRRALADFLSELGYESATAADGAEGLNQALHQAFDVVLVDLRMPKVDGLQVIETLKLHRPDLPIIVVSGTGVLREVIEAIRRGAWDYVTKPIHDMDEITVIIERVLERARLIAERDRYEQELERLNQDLQKEVARQTEYLRLQNRELTVLNHVIATAATTLDSVRILRVLCAELALAFGLARVSARLLAEGSSTAPIVAEYRAPGIPEMLGSGLELDQPVLAQVLQTQRPAMVQNLHTDPRFADLCQEVCYRGLLSLLLVPLVARGSVIAILELGSAEARQYDESDLDLIQNAAAAAAQALEAASLHQELQQHAETLETMVAQRTQELRVALLQARAADEAKSQFVSSVSHELRTPLTSIRLYLDLLSRGKTGNWDRYLESLKRETERLQSLIESLLLISRLDLGKTRLSLSTVDLNELMETLVSDRRRLFAERGLQLEVDLHSEMPRIMADPKLLEQVATNLLTNALNYTPSGGRVRLSTGLAKSGGQHWVTFCVQDTGPGISREDQAHLFQRFYRGTAGQSSNAPGTGLGLAICKEIIDLHQGRITIDSEPAKGARFTVWLPRKATSPLAAEMVQRS